MIDRYNNFHFLIFHSLERHNREGEIYPPIEEYIEYIRHIYPRFNDEIINFSANQHRLAEDVFA